MSNMKAAAPKGAFDKIGLLGVNIDAASIVEAIDYLCRRSRPGQAPGYVTKPYVEFLDQAYRQPKLCELLNNAELTLADGVALVWAAHYLYAGPRTLVRFWRTLFAILLAPNSLRWPIPDRAAGINFTWPLLEQAAAQHLRIYLIGSPKHGAIEHTADVLRQGISGLKVVGTLNGRDATMPIGQVSQQWLETTRSAIAETKPDLILVGMGFPLQEKVCAYLAAHTDHGMFIGEGGTFDYERFGGTSVKAPTWMQRAGLEWLWRLIQEPRRLKRQLAIPRFIYRIWKNR